MAKERVSATKIGKDYFKELRESRREDISNDGLFYRMISDVVRFSDGGEQVELMGRAIKLNRVSYSVPEDNPNSLWITFEEKEFKVKFPPGVTEPVIGVSIVFEVNRDILFSNFFGKKYIMEDGDTLVVQLFVTIEDEK